MIKSFYGMMVTNIARDEILYNGEWIEKKITSELVHASSQSFLAILEFGEDYIYSDTDSLKCLNFDAVHEEMKKER